MSARGIFSTTRRAALAGIMCVATALAEPAPVVSFGFRGTAGEVLEVGEPLAVVVTLRAPEDARSPITLAPEARNWTRAITVELAPVASGTGKTLQAAALGKPDAPHATLDQVRIAGGGWLFASAATAALAPGDYVVRVSVRIADGSGWRGESSAPSRNVRVVAATANSARRTVALAGEQVLQGQLEAAVARLDAFLKTNPREPAVWALRATLAERAGNVASALWYANQVDSSAGTVKGLPLLELRELRRRLQARLQEPVDSAEPPPPAWSWPARELLERRFAEVAKTLPASPAVARVVAPVSVQPAVSPTAPTQPITNPVASAATPPVAPKINPSLGGDPAPTKPGEPSAGVLVLAKELPEGEILAEPAGQWAETAVAGSQYDSRTYTAAEATGAPNVPKTGDSPKAWCHHGSSKEIDWLELGFATPVRATEVRVRQTLNPGTIIKLEAIEPDGTSHVWWEGRDAAGLALPAGSITWFAVRVAKPEYVVARVKITLDLKLRVGWKQIDAVQLVEAK